MNLINTYIEKDTNWIDNNISKSHGGENAKYNIARNEKIFNKNRKF